MDDSVIHLLGELTRCDVRLGELARDDRVLRWAEAGSGQPVVVLDAALGEPGMLAWASVMPLVAPKAHAVAYDRAGIGLSDPMSPLTLDAQVDDLTSVLEACGDGPCIVVGHSWGGLLAQLVAWRRPDLVAGLVLIDPADERYLATSPTDELREGVVMGEAAIAQHASGELPTTIRSVFSDFARQLSDDPVLAERALDAYIASYATESQARMVLDETLLVIDSLPRIQKMRESQSLLDIPVVILSATTGTPKPQRERYTSFHAEVATSVLRGEHIVLPDTSHAANQERPAEIAGAINRIVDSARRGSRSG